MSLAQIQLGVGLVGLASLLLGVFRIPAKLDEFSEEEPVVKDPLNHAVSGDVTWAKFKSDEWQGFRALDAAMRLRVFLDRHRFFLNPRSGFGAFVALLLGAVLLYAALGILGMVSAVATTAGGSQGAATVPQNAIVSPQSAATLAQGLLVAWFGLVTAWWGWMIELGKTLKRAASRLRVQ